MLFGQLQPRPCRGTQAAQVYCSVFMLQKQVARSKLWKSSNCFCTSTWKLWQDVVYWVQTMWLYYQCPCFYLRCHFLFHRRDSCLNWSYKVFLLHVHSENVFSKRICKSSSIQSVGSFWVTGFAHFISSFQRYVCFHISAYF